MEIRGDSRLLHNVAHDLLPLVVFNPGEYILAPLLKKIIIIKHFEEEIILSLSMIVASSGCILMLEAHQNAPSCCSNDHAITLIDFFSFFCILGQRFSKWKLTADLYTLYCRGNSKHAAHNTLQNSFWVICPCTFESLKKINGCNSLMFKAISLFSLSN